MVTECFFKKTGQTRPLDVYFRPFYMSNVAQIHRWCALDSNPGWQDGRCRRIHWANVNWMLGATTTSLRWTLTSITSWSTLTPSKSRSSTLQQVQSSLFLPIYSTINCIMSNAPIWICFSSKDSNLKLKWSLRLVQTTVILLRPATKAVCCVKNRKKSK